MARRRYSKKSRGKKKFTLPVAAIAPIAIIAVNAMGQYQRGGFNEVKNVTLDAMVNPSKIVGFYSPVAAGLLVHMLASRLGANRMLGQAGVPILRI